MNDNEFFDIPVDQIEQISGAMSGEGIRLPFTAPVLWWMNGKASLKRDGDVPYFGGWSSNSDEFMTSSDEFGGIPPIFSPFTLTNDEGKDFDVFCARSIGFALIAKRQRWVVDETTGKGRGHNQFLGVLSFKDGSSMKSWGPVVLSGKGFSGKLISDALMEFERKTARVRRESARGLPAWFFYAILGTFGQEPQKLMVGKGTQQSPITPCKAWLPENITIDNLKAWYVGNEVAQKMADYRKQAQEWLDAWREVKGQQIKTDDEQKAAEAEPGDFPF